MLHNLQVTAGNCTASHCHALPVSKDIAPIADILAAAAGGHHESTAHTMHSLDTARALLYPKASGGHNKSTALTCVKPRTLKSPCMVPERSYR